MKQIYLLKAYILCVALLSYQLSASAQCPAGTSCNTGGSFTNNQTVYITTSVDAAITLKSGAKLIIGSGGYYTGTLNASKNTSVQVEQGGRFEPNLGGLLAGELTNNGTSVINGSYTANASFSVSNYSMLTFTGSLTDNGRVTVTNTACGTTNFNGSVQLVTTGSAIQNEGTMVIKASINTGAAASIVNQGRLYVEGSFTGAGLVRNTNFMVMRGSMNFNSGDSLVNTHILVLDGSVNVSRPVRNEGLLWVPSGSFQVNGPVMRQNNPQALMRIDATFMNNSVFTAAGNLHVGSTITNNGAINGISSVNKLKVNKAFTGTQSNVTIAPVILYDTTNYVYGYKQEAVCPLTTLPVFFKDVKGLKSEGINKIYWSTGFEKNIDRFEVEHSIDGKKYELIGTIAAAGNAGGSSYQHEHRYKIGGDHFYRVRSIDIDGTIKISHVILLKNDVFNAPQIIVAGNPFRDVISVVITSEANTLSSINVYDRSGKLVKQQAVQLKAGSNNVQVAGLSNVLSGMCVVEIRFDQQRHTLKLIKQ